MSNSERENWNLPHKNKAPVVPEPYFYLYGLFFHEELIMRQ